LCFLVGSQPALCFSLVLFGRQTSLLASMRAGQHSCVASDVRTNKLDDVSRQ
jgi:hypothetical protein